MVDITNNFSSLFKRKQDSAKTAASPANVPFTSTKRTTPTFKSLGKEAPVIPIPTTAPQSTVDGAIKPPFAPPVQGPIRPPVTPTPLPAPTAAATPSDGTFTTPSGATVDTSGKVISPPTTDAGAVAETDPQRDTFREALLASLTPSKEEKGIQEELARMLTGFETGVEGIRTQAIPTGLLRGQAAALERQVGLQAAPLQRQLGLLQEQRTGEQTRAETELGFREADIEAAKPPEAEPGFTLAPGQTRFDASGEVVASGGPKPISEAAITAAIARTEKDEAARASQTTTIGIINEILGSEGLGKVSGKSRFGIAARTAATGDVRAKLVQLKALTSLGERDKLKGSGTISDFEAGMLANSATSLNFAIQDDGKITLSDEEADQALRNIRGVLLAKTGELVTVIASDPATGVTERFENVTREDIENAALKGLLIDYE